MIEEIKEIVEKQVQVRTSKLKPLIEDLEEGVKAVEEAAPVTPNTDPEKEKRDADLVKENQYLKRRQTMYDLKISKLENEIKALKSK